MDLQTEINWIQSELVKVKDPDLIKAIKSLLKYRGKQVQSDWWDEISDEEKASIERGLAQSAEEETKPHKEVMEKYKK
jgi:hypothetical protein